MEFSIQLRNKQILKGFIKNPEKDVYAGIILIHGLGEHIHRYENWAEKFRGKGIVFTGMDLPGHGKSDGSRGNIKSYSQTDEMIEILLDTTRNTYPGIPLFLYGHSLGGGIVLDYLIRKNPGIKGAIVTSPWLKLSFEPPRTKIVLASIMKHVLPGLAQPSGLVIEDLSHDIDVVKKYSEDPMVHDKISVSLFHSAMSAAATTLENAASLDLPVLLMHGGNDRICSVEGSRQFASLTSRAELKIWDDGYHELHNEPFRDEVFSYIIRWINNRIS